MDITIAQAIEAVINSQQIQHNLRRAEAEVTQLIGEQIRALRTRIRAGETTGHTLRDFLIVNHLTLDVALEKEYLNVELAMAGCVGEFVLTLHSRQVYCRSTKRNAPRLCFELGVLMDGRFIHDRSNHCGLPVCQRLRESDTAQGEVALLRGPIDQYFHHFHHFILAEQFQSTQPRKERILVIVGDQDVRTWLETNRPNGKELFQKYAKQLARTFAEM